MADVIKNFSYSKTRGRGRGILGLTNFDPCRRPGERSASTTSSGHDQSVSNSSQNGASVKEPPQARERTEESASVYTK